MPRYMVERYLPGFTNEQVVAAATAAKITTAQMTSEGTPIRYLRSVFVPGEDKCFCMFEGPSAEKVLEANDRAGLPYERVVEAQFVVSEDLS